MPVVATRVGGIPGALPEECGLLVDAGSPMPLADAMAKMLTLAPEQREAMGSAARRHAIAQYGVGKMVERYLAIYAAAIAKRANSVSA